MAVSRIRLNDCVVQSGAALLLCKDGIYADNRYLSIVMAMGVYRPCEMKHLRISST